MTANPEADAPDRSRSFAVLVGASTFPHSPDLQALPAAARSLDAMERLLKSGQCGWTEDRMLVLPDWTSKEELFARITPVLQTNAEQVTDAVLFYYVGHGLLIDGGASLGMALNGTADQGLRRKQTSLHLSEVRDLLGQLPYAAKIEIFDCCYSGIASNVLGSPDALQDKVSRAVEDNSDSRYTVTASRRNEEALYWTADDGMTYFTGYLQEIVAGGIEGAPAYLTMSRIFLELHKRFRALAAVTIGESVPLPTQVATSMAGEFPFARNKAFQETGTIPITVPEPEGGTGTVRSGTQPQWDRRTVLTAAAGATLAGVGGFALWVHGRTEPSAQPGSQNAAKTHPAATTSAASAGPTGSAAATQASASADPHHFTKAVTVAGSPLALGGPQAVAVALSRSGRNLLAVADQNGAVHLWDTTDFTRPKRVGGPFGATGTAYGDYSLAFSPMSGRQILAAGNSGGQILLWDLAEPAAPRLLKQFSSGTGNGCAVSFSPDGSMLASASLDGYVSLWVTGDPDNVYSWGAAITGHDGAVNAAVFSPRQYLVASGGYDETVRLWNISDASLPESLHVFKETDGPVRSLAFSPDGNTLAAGKGSGVVRLYDVTTPSAPTLRGPLPQAQQNWVNTVAFSRDSLLACASADHSVQLYDLTDPGHPREIQRNLAVFTDQASSLAFTADGRGLAAGGIDSTIELWQLS